MTVPDFLRLHNAEGYDWHKRLSGTYEGDWPPNLVLVTPLPDGRVHFFWSGQQIHQRFHRAFAPGEYREQTEQSLRRMAAL